MVQGKTFGIVTTCMNREVYLRASLFSWERFLPEFIDRIIIVDWSSASPLSFPESKAEILRVNNQEHFDSGKARNTGIRYCNTDWILAIDSDIVISGADYIDSRIPSFFQRIGPLLLENCFFTRDTTLGVDQNLTGTVLFERKAWEKINGYPENLLGWGFEDLNFQHRLLMVAGCKEYRILNHDHFFHIPHSNLKRIENYEFQNVDKMVVMNANRNIVRVVNIESQEQEKQVVIINGKALWV